MLYQQFACSGGDLRHVIYHSKHVTYMCPGHLPGHISGHDLALDVWCNVVAEAICHVRNRDQHGSMNRMILARLTPVVCRPRQSDPGLSWLFNTNMILRIPCAFGRGWAPVFGLVALRVYVMCARTNGQCRSWPRVH